MGVRAGNVGAQLEGKLGEPPPDTSLRAVCPPSQGSGDRASGSETPPCGRPPEVSPPESAHPDERPTPSCKQRAEMGRVKQPHPLMSPRGLDPGQNPSQTPAQPWGHPPWGLIGKLLPGSPRNHWGPWDRLARLGRRATLSPLLPPPSGALVQPKPPPCQGSTRAAL